MRKTNKATPSNYSTIQNLAVSRTAATMEQVNTRDECVAVDWAIVNKTAIPGEANVFAVFEDTNIGIVHVVCTTSRGLAGEALLNYIQQWGTPKTIHHDNAEEFLKGKFAEICTQKGIRQTQSAPYTPNQNPTEKYMDILVSGARSLLYTSGLQPAKFWTHAIQHRTLLQNFMALPGRCTPYELATGKQPNVATLRIFGCEAMAYVERDKRKKFSPKTDRCIYLGISPTHSHDTYKLWHIEKQILLYRRNVAFNERIFPGRLLQDVQQTRQDKDTGYDLVGLSFKDEGESFTVHSTGEDNEGNPTLLYSNPTNPRPDGKKHESTVAEVRGWYQTTRLHQAANSCVTGSKNFINTLAYISYKEISTKKAKTYHTKLQNPTKHKAPTSYKKAGNKEQQWFEAEDKERDGMLEFNTWERIP